MNVHILRQQTGTQNILHRKAADIPKHRTLSCASTAGQNVILIFVWACSHDNEDRSTEITLCALKGFNDKWDTTGKAEFMGMRKGT
jgi:hypothetical protein